MGTHTIQRTSVPTTHSGSGESGRLLFVTVGGAALVVAAFLNWTRDMTGISMSNHALIGTSFFTQADIVRTVGGISVVIGLAGMFGLVERSGWLTRLFGLFGVALFVMFLIEVLRSSVHTLQPGAWLALAGGLAMLIGGFLPAASGAGSESMIVEERRIDAGEPAPPPMEEPRTGMESGSRGYGTGPDSESPGGIG